MGEVYRADDLKLGQPVALKFLPERSAFNAQALSRFHNEVRIARQVSHPNVCRVYDIGEAEEERLGIEGEHDLDELPRWRIRDIDEGMRRRRARWATRLSEDA